MLDHRCWHVKTAATLAIVIALASSIGTSRLTAALGDTRTLTLFNIHTKETITVLYKKDNRWLPGAKEKLDWAMRDWRRNEKAAMDPELYDLLWDIHTELGSRDPIHIISGYRSKGTNEQLRNTVGGQASESRHILGKAVDVHFPDVPVSRLRYSALIRERGGVGYYPTSALPFVHMDTDRVRSWPRLPRMELALLFPQGQTKHQPAEGGPITGSDVRMAQSQKKTLATEVAAYHDFRKSLKIPVAIADASAAGFRSGDAPAPARPPVAIAAASPQLIDPPRVVERSSKLEGPSLPGPSIAERFRLGKLMQLASAFTTADTSPQLLQGPQPARRPQTEPPKPSLSGAEALPAPAAKAPPARIAAVDPRQDEPARPTVSDAAGWGNGFAIAPAFDDEHPEELSYRPFPIAPYMTATASADDPALATLTHPDVARILEAIDQFGSVQPMKLRPPQRTAALMLAQQFRGEAVGHLPPGDEEPQSAQSSRKVPTR